MNKNSNVNKGLTSDYCGGVIAVSVAPTPKCQSGQSFIIGSETGIIETMLYGTYDDFDALEKN
jgi:hypothetical protein